MRAVQFDCIEAKPLRIKRRAHEGSDYPVDILEGHLAAAGNFGAGKAGGAFERWVRRVRIVEILAAADMP